MVSRASWVIINRLPLVSSKSVEYCVMRYLWCLWCGLVAARYSVEMNVGGRAYDIVHGAAAFEI